MRIMLFRHFDFDDPSVLTEWANARDCAVALFEPPSGEPFPDPDAFELLVVLGGPMSVTQAGELPWLAAERRYVRDSIARGKHVLGICLGAQLAAAALGSRVYRNGEKEIGWHWVARTGERHPLVDGLPRIFHSFHWHGDTFELPSGAVHLAFSDACRNQAFAYGDRVLGLQFHLETTPAAMAAMTEAWAGELAAAPHIQPADEMLDQTARCRTSAGYLHAVLDNFLRVFHDGQASAG